MPDFYERYWKEKASDTLDDFHYKWPVIERYIPTKKGVNILDFGCGRGKITREIVKINPLSKITGIDISKEAIRTARRENNIKLVYTTDSTKLPFKNSSFDFILASDVIEHIYETEETINELFRVLRKGGRLLISTPYHGLIKNLIIVLTSFNKVFDVTGPHIRFFTTSALINLLTKGQFEINKVGYFGRFFPVWRGFFVLADKN